MRLRSDIFVSAYMRRCAVEGAYALLRRRGAAEAGAIFVKIDWLDGRCSLFGPAPQSEIEESGSGRAWIRLHAAETISGLEAEDRMRREIAFDPDLWIVDVDDRHGRHFLELARNGP